VTGPREHGNKGSGYKKDGKFIEEQRNFQLYDND
jgi:hypothetical protein